MAKTADLSDVQKRVIDTHNKDDKPEKVIIEQVGCIWAH